jgi:hypothetical protein
MSQIEAYKCDYCNMIVEYDDVIGLKAMEDMFDRLASYPDTPPAKATVHLCMHCVRLHVLTPLDNEFPHRNAKEKEAGYTLRFRELHYNLRKSTIDRYREKTIAQNRKKR